MVLKCNSIKPDLFFKSHIYAMLFRIHVFQGQGFKGSKFFLVSVITETLKYWIGVQRGQS